LTNDGFAVALFPWLKNVARSPLLFNTANNFVVLLADGPSSNVIPTYPLQVAASDGIAATVMAVAATAIATPAIAERFQIARMGLSS
jgi:hypothetical protein